ncbi:ETS homologous factor-like isoform X1 [Leptopilina boulardi]|uniref:ETS homologous factor-like isoform X1 n=1 Tax=Leptopilina boulardi TaxID=63433 RepID=UPI0021F6263B|nr:ETS homologous factor-like isoform X1 [Leptopilina boulardi]
MDPYMDYQKSGIPDNYYSALNDEEGDHLLLDMDSISTQKTNSLVARLQETSRKKCTLGEEKEESDGAGWSEKPIKDWCQEETINWLISAASHMGQSYSSIQHSLAIPGKDLITLTRNDFIAHDSIYGERLYDLLHSQRNSNLNFDAFPRQSEDESATMSSTNASDAESENSIEISTKRPPGRPRLLKTKKPSGSQGKLWEFIRDLLRNRKTCPSLICWEDYSQAKFRFVRSDEVAKLWGSRKGNTKMTYEKLSRAMRYYYKRKIFLPVLGRRLVYQFGPNATGWQTDNPNFRY